MIVTFGSINIDFVFTMAAMPTPGQTLLAKTYRTEAGGKGANQALAAVRDGAEVCMVGAIGNDALADSAIRNLSASGADISRVSRLALPTGCASIFIDALGRNMIAIAPCANLAAASDAVDDVLMQMENEPSEIEKLIRRARQADKTSILNLAPAVRLDSEVLSLCDLIVVNEDEALDLAGWLGCEPSARAISSALNTGVLRTLGAEGAEAFVHGKEARVAAVPVETVDTTAAGDCFIGVLASALDCGLPIEAAMRRAAAAAAIACSRAGSQASIPHGRDTDAFY